MRSWLSMTAQPNSSSVDLFRQAEEFLESLLERKNSHQPLALVSEDTVSYAGVFILSRIMLHFTRHGGECTVIN